MKEITILLSACGSPSMPGMIACFRNNGERRIRIVGMDMNEEPSNRYLVDASILYQLLQTQSIVIGY